VENPAPEKPVIIPVGLHSGKGFLLVLQMPLSSILLIVWRIWWNIQIRLKNSVTIGKYDGFA